MSLPSIVGEFAERFYHRVKPVELSPPGNVLYILRHIYPTVNWNKVHFYNSLPWYILPSRANAIALPGTLDSGHIHIYFNRNFDPDSSYGLGLIIHEGFHVLQYTDTGAHGPGFARLFLVYYFGCWLRNGYRKSPMEIPAYKQEQHFVNCCRDLIAKVTAEEGYFTETFFLRLLKENPSLVHDASGFRYRCGILPLCAGVMITLMAAVIIPLVSIVLWLMAFVLRGMAGLSKPRL